MQIQISDTDTERIGNNYLARQTVKTDGNVGVQRHMGYGSCRGMLGLCSANLNRYSEQFRRCLLMVFSRSM
jgi:hypothetical protein